MLNLKNPSYVTVIVCTIILFVAFLYIITTPPTPPGFFQAWILGSDDMLPDTLDVDANESRSLLVTIENNYASAKSCELRLSVRRLSDNATYQLTNSQSVLQPAETWTTNVTFTFTGHLTDDLVNISLLTINSEGFLVDYTSSYGADLDHHVFQFFFGLWVFDEQSNRYIFTETWVSSPFLELIL